MASSNCACFDNSGELVYIGSEDATVKAYNVVSGEKEADMKGHEDTVNAVLMDSSKDGYFFFVSSDFLFRFWQ